MRDVVLEVHVVELEEGTGAVVEWAIVVHHGNQEERNNWTQVRNESLVHIDIMNTELEEYLIEEAIKELFEILGTFEEESDWTRVHRLGSQVA